VTPISPPPIRRYLPGYLPAYLSNGVVGLRAGRLPQLEGLAILSGFAGVDPASGVESFARVPYPLAGGLEIDGLPLSEAARGVVLDEQAYDFSCGELRTRFHLDTDRARASVEVVTFCSRTLPSLVLQEVALRVDHACDVGMRCGVDHVGVLGTFGDRRTQPRTGGDAVSGSLRWKSYGGLSQCGIAYVCEFLGAEATEDKAESDMAALSSTFRFRARTGRTYRLRQISAVVSEEVHHQPDLQAVRLAFGSLTRGFDRIRAENADAWRELWQGRVNLVGAPSRWQAMADAAYFYIQTSAHASSPASTSMFGLGYWPNYHYYRGHVMWDIETFTVPPLILTQPEAARALLEYRSRRLEAARNNASMHGYRGVQFPWESSLRLGEEATPGEGAAAAHEHHVSPDVAYAFSQFLHATHDWEWGRVHAWPVLQGVAEWVASRGVETARGFEIKEAGGVAEKPSPVDNNAFVNVGARTALLEATRFSEPLRHRADPDWERLARAMFVPVDRSGVIRNHDGYRKTEDKGETPEAAAALFPQAYDCTPEVERSTFAFYLELADEYVGAPMLSALLGVYAARVGDRERALELFERGYASFVVDPFSTTTEYDRERFPEQPVAGPFTANMGGFLLSCLYGLPGIQLGEGEPASWCGRPVVLPAGWDAIEVERMWARGREARLVAQHGAEHATIAWQ
jgi:trehalose/maltose hydrolase-like predicted phosphorylase